MGKIEPALLTPGRCLMIGQAPGPSRDPRPLVGACGGRLADLAGIGQPGGHELRLSVYFDRANVLDEYLGPHPNGGGDWFPMPVARAAANKMRAAISAYPYVVFIGAATAEAFGHKAPFFRWDYGSSGAADTPSVAIVPHPSGVNRWWNEPANPLAAAYFLQELVLKVRA